jgi:hypothetical protein
MGSTLGVAKTGLGGHGFGSGIVGLARQVEFRPMRHHAKHSESTGAVAGYRIGPRQPNQRRHIAWIGFRLIG